MAALVRIAPDFGAVWRQRAFEFMDRRCLRAPHDVERDGLMRVAAKAFHFEIAKPRIERVAKRRRWLRRTLKAEHALVPSLDGSRSASLRACAPVLPPPGPIRRKWSRVTCCPWREDAPGHADRQAATDCGGWRDGHNRGDVAPRHRQACLRKMPVPNPPCPA